MKAWLSHLFLPQDSNNHRAKILHHQSLAYLIIIFIAIQIVFFRINTSSPQVLGTTTDISAQELLHYSNIERIKYNLSPLTLNNSLSVASENKAKNMFQFNYWAHFSPTGTTPWSFIKAAGYDYVYAGENLARGFTDSQSIVDAWMNSPTHRANQLSSNYTDVGYAVEDGTLLGEPTTLVVEMFGSTTQSLAKLNSEKNALGATTIVLSPTPEGTGLIPTLVGSVGTKMVKYSFINSILASKTIAFALLSMLIILLLLDAVFIEKKKIYRHIGNHIDHLLFFSTLLFFVLLIGEGVIL